MSVALRPRTSLRHLLIWGAVATQRTLSNKTYLYSHIIKLSVTLLQVTKRIQDTHDIELNLDVSTGGPMKGWGNWVVFVQGIVQTRKYGIAYGIVFSDRKCLIDLGTHKELQQYGRLQMRMDFRGWLQRHGIGPKNFLTLSRNENTSTERRGNARSSSHDRN